MARLTGIGKPTTHTKGNTGDIYVDTSSRKLYQCSFIVTIGSTVEYTWDEVGVVVEDTAPDKVNEEHNDQVEPTAETKEAVIPEEPVVVTQPRNYTDYSRKNKKNKH